MNNNQNDNTKQMTLVDAFRLLVKKSKIIVCIALAAFIIAGAISAVNTIFDAHYGSSVTFYITPSDTTTSLLPLLKSETFAEKLLLEANGLPKKSECADQAAYDEAVKAIADYEAAREAKKQAKKLVDLMPTEVAIVEQRHAELQTQYNETVSRLNTLYSSAEAIVDDEHLAKIDEYETLLAKIREEKNEYDKNYYYPTLIKKREADEQYAKATENLKEARAKAEELTQKVLEKWREGDGIEAQVAMIQNCISFEYIKYDESIEKFDEQNQNDAFLVVSISVPEDEELAKEILDKVKSYTPDFVVKQIERLNNATDVSCTLTTPYSDVGSPDSSGIIKESLITAVFAAVAAAAIVSFVIIAAQIIKNDDKSNEANDAEDAEKAEE